MSPSSKRGSLERTKIIRKVSVCFKKGAVLSDHKEQQLLSNKHPHKIRKQAGTGACFLYAAKRLGPAGGVIPVFLDFYSDSCKINQYAKLHKNGEDEQYPDCTARERGSWAERPLRNRTRGRSHRSSKRNESRLLRSAKPGGQSDSNERNKGGTADYRCDSRFVLCSRSYDLHSRDGFFY